MPLVAAQFYNAQVHIIASNGLFYTGGVSLETGSRVATRWVNGVQEFLKDNEDNYIGEGIGVSADGKVVVGGNGFSPYVWNTETGYEEISHPQIGMFFLEGQA